MLGEMEQVVPHQHLYSVASTAFYSGSAATPQTILSGAAGTQFNVINITATTDDGGNVQAFAAESADAARDSIVGGFYGADNGEQVAYSPHFPKRCGSGKGLFVAAPGGGLVIVRCFFYRTTEA